VRCRSRSERDRWLRATYACLAHSSCCRLSAVRPLSWFKVGATTFRTLASTWCRESWRSASSPRRRGSAARCFAVSFGPLYLMLAVLGQLEAPAVAGLHLEVADHAFHAVAGAVTFAVGARRGRIGPDLLMS
jgi:hypothetical protein